MDELDRTDWQRYCDGDAAGFTRIYHRHKNSLLTYLLYAGHSREAGEDILQDTFLGLSRQKTLNRQIEIVRNWLFICARNLSLNRLKGRRMEFGKIAEMPAFEPATDRDLDLQKVLAQLEPGERELILLRELHGFAVAELANMFNLSEEAIRVRLYRIRKRMFELGKDCK